MLNTGDFAFDTVAGANVQILERIEMWGYTSYKVFNPATGRVYKATEEQLNTSGNAIQYDENYLRYVALLSKIKNETAGGFLSALASGIIPLPHQLHVLNRAMETNNIRYILADEVGLGKTIEAGMIIKELKSRGLVQRVLVVCPTGLVTQWASEMQEKFHEKFHVILPSDYDTIRRLTDADDVYGQYDQVISPMDSIKPIEKHAGWTDERVEKYNEERIYPSSIAAGTLSSSMRPTVLPVPPVRLPDISWVICCRRQARICCFCLQHLTTAKLSRSCALCDCWMKRHSLTPSLS
jgi:SNF2 family DNA or RNA helicase